MDEFPDSWTCFNCGQPGHVAAGCPEGKPEPTADRPAWCGGCDPRTRLEDHGNYMRRCPRCRAWPAKGTRPGQPLAQHKRCGGCSQLIYAWDQMPCGKHQPLAHNRRITQDN